MRKPLDVIVPAAIVAMIPSAFDTVTVVGAILSGGDLWSGHLSAWVFQAAGGATLGWLAVLMSVAALNGRPAIPQLLASVMLLAAALVAWSTPTALAYVACGLVGLLAARDARVGRTAPRLHWSERNAAVRAGVVITLVSGPLAVILGPLALLGTTVGATLMAVGSLAERDGLHGGADSAVAKPSVEEARLARVRRHRIHAGNLCLGAGLIGVANLVYWFVGPTVSGVDPVALILIGGLFIVAVPMLAIGLIMGAFTVAESREHRRHVPSAG